MNVYAKAAVLAITLALGTGIAHAETFDSKRFFDKLQAEGVSAPAGFDGKKFFDKLQAEGVSEQKPLDSKTFFDKLETFCTLEEEEQLMETA